MFFMAQRLKLLKYKMSHWNREAFGAIFKNREAIGKNRDELKIDIRGKDCQRTFSKAQLWGPWKSS